MRAHQNTIIQHLYTRKWAKTIFSLIYHGTSVGSWEIEKGAKEIECEEDECETEKEKKINEDIKAYEPRRQGQAGNVERGEEHSF